MDWLLLSLAVIGAVVLLFKYALAPAKDGAIRAERMKRSAALGRLYMLGKKCRTVGFGLGVDYRAVKLAKAINRVRKCELAHDIVFQAITDNAEILSRAEAYGKSALRRHGIPHVGKFPRVYLLCREMVLCTRGDIADICIDGVRVFEKNAQLSAKERHVFKGVLVYCLCALLYKEISAELKHYEKYSQGFSDGQKGKLDLDRLSDADYICGLLSRQDSDMQSDALRMLADNGIHARKIVNDRTVRVCSFYATVCAVLRSLKFCDGLHVEERGNEKTEARRRAEIALTAVGGVGIAASAVFTAVMFSARYFTVFCVLAIIVYGVTRFPVLMLADTDETLFGAVDNTDGYIYDEAPRILAMQTEAAYFGCEPVYHSYTVTGSSVSVCADNRGALKLLTVHNGIKKKLPISIGFVADYGSIELEMFDGAFEKHRITYRAVCADADFTVEVVPSCSSASCLIKLTVVNRTEDNLTVVSRVLLGNAYVCAAVCFDGGYLDGQLCAEKSFEIAPFDKASIYCAVALGNDVAQAEQLAQYGACESSYDFAVDCMRAYCCDGRALPNTGTTSLYRVIKSPQNKYWDTPEIAERELTLTDGHCGYTTDGAFVCDGKHDYINMLYGGNGACGSVGANGVVYYDGATARNCMCFVGEGEAIWSPFTDCNEIEHGFGYSRLTRAYNGCVISSCVTASTGAVFIELNIENSESADRTLDLLFTVDVQNGEVVGDGMHSFGVENAVIVCSQKFDETTKYKEGFYSYGKIGRVCALGDQGSTVLPAVSVRVKLPSHGTGNIVFAVANIIVACSLGEKLCDEFFDGVLKQRTTHAERLSPFELKSDNIALNFFYKRAIYDAYCSYMLRDNYSVADLCLMLATLKYVEKSLAEQGIKKLLSMQRNDGQLGNDAFGGIYAAALVLDYIDFCDDKSLLQEVCPFTCDDNTIAFASVLEHCLLALDYALPLLNSDMTDRVCTPSVLCTDKTALSLLHRFSDIDIGYSRKSRYTDALCKTAERYSRHAAVFARGCAEFEDYSAKNVLLYSRALFYIGNTDKAVKILLGCNPLQRYSAGNKLTRYSERETLGGAECALFYSLVTEKIIGAAFSGSLLRLTPVGCDAGVHFDISYDGKKISVAVDGQGKGKQWFMRIGNIKYSSNSVDLKKTADGAHIMLIKSDGANG